MKPYKLIASSLLAIALCLSLLACGGENNDGGCKHRDADDDTVCDKCFEYFEDGIEPADGIIYSESVYPAIVYKKGDVDYVVSRADDILSALRENAGLSTSAFHDFGAKFDKEIVIGDTSREVTAAAKAILADKLSAAKTANPDVEDLSGYLIYSDGNSVAIVWTDFQLAELAVSYFVDNYVTGASLTLDTGFTKSDFFSLTAYLQEREDNMIEAKWASLEAALPEEYRAEIITALKHFYTLFDYDLAVQWVASLYDAATGGFYISESARDTAGFGPDIESTYYGICYPGTMGMAEMFGGNWWEVWPEDLLMKTANWIYSLQDADGYYYVPQWPKSYIEANGLQVRITRDKGSADTILNRAGIKAKYTSAFAGNSYLADYLGESAAVAVSKAVYSASELLEQYESVENFKKYLADLEKELNGISDADRAGKFYLWGSYFQSTTGLMNDEMKTLMVEFFDKHQNPENGVWSEDLHYASTDAIHKICSTYTKVNAEIKYAEKIFDSVLEILAWDVDDHPVSTTVGIYNVWSCFSYIYENITKCSNATAAEKEARCDALRMLVFSGTADAINAAYDQLYDFRVWEDGSFHTFREHSVITAHGCPASVPHTKEGDIGGYLIAAYDMPHYILDALGLIEHEIPYNTEIDRLRFIELIRAQEPIDKGDLAISEPILRDFESDVIGEAPEGFNVVLDAGKVPNDGAYIKVANDGTGNKVLEFNATAKKVDNGRNFYATTNATHSNEEPNVTRLEFKIKMNSGGGMHALDIFFRAFKMNGIVIESSIATNSKNEVFFLAHSKKIGTLGKMGEWIDFAIEYEWGKGEYRVYSGDTLVGTGNSTYNNSANHEMVSMITLGANSSTTANYYIDDLCFYTYKKQ